jgi:hypothetical protein
MIGKVYSIFCHECTKVEELFSSTMKDATEEAKRMGWKVGKIKMGGCGCFVSY